MRVRVVWSAFALLLLVTISGALRTSQREGASRVRGRLTSTSVDSSSNVNKSEEIKPTFRPRDSKREEITPRDNVRSRSRSRSTTTEPTSAKLNNSQFESRRDEKLDSRGPISRTRSRPIANEATVAMVTQKDSIIRRRTRQKNNHLATQMTPLSTESTKLPENKEIYDNIDSVVQDVPKQITKEYMPTNQFKRRSSTDRSVENVIPVRARGRINTRLNSKPLDLDLSGTVNTMTVAVKEQTTTRTEDFRNSRKLKYKTRLSEVDTNLTGNGFTASNGVKSSQERENITSQPETSSPQTSKSNERQFNVKTSTLRTMKILKRPLSREIKKNYIPIVNTKISDEISEDDNYPASFKALIQAKNASTNASSPSESLAVTASQKILKTFTPTSQSNISGPDTDDWRRRSKTETDYNKTDSSKVIIKVTESIEQSKPRLNSRGVYNQENQNLSDPAILSTTTSTPSSQKIYKYSRSFKRTTTEIPSSFKDKRTNLFKKTTNRSLSYTSRNPENISNVSSEVPTMRINIKNSNFKSENSLKPKQILPRTIHYSRSRNSASKLSPSTEKYNDIEMSVADKKIENTADMPIIFTYLNNNRLKNADNIDTTENISKDVENTFIVKVSSKESVENVTDNNINKSKNDKALFNGFATTTQKYHATYKDNNSNNVLENKPVPTVASPIKNIQTRKYSRKNNRTKKNEDENIVTQKTKERSSKKYSDTFSKTTEPSSNGIIAESEKSKNKFSSKYRASYLDRPLYKPTVPTITPSTAWLKFFVTERLLTKSAEQPQWFEEEDFFITTTEQMPIQNVTSTLIQSDSSKDLVKGEEIQLGPDINAISFTKPRRPLSSANLKLSESFTKPLQVMNVEASNHSPSVTVSIFDALADILTSTPKPRLSSTTEVLNTQKVDSNAKQILDGVSSSNNVNMVNGLVSQDTLITTDVISTTAKIVQTTNVFNSMSVGGNVRLNSKEENDNSVKTTTSVPFLTSSTPISERKPFAIKVLYSETEPPKDKTTGVQSTTTDSPTMVYNTVSDLLLSNNGLVSSELTSMLSKNIKMIIQNMNDDSKSKLSVDMAKVLNVLIPKVLSRRKTLQQDEDLILNTTPYSFDDIKDTENIDVGAFDNLNNATENQVANNEVVVNRFNTDSDILKSTTAVNSISTLEVGTIKNTFIASEDKTTFVPFLSKPSESDTDKKNSMTEQNVNDSTTLPESSDVEMLKFERITESSLNNKISSFTNKPLPIPFLTNFQNDDFSSLADDEEILSNNLQKVTLSFPTTANKLAELQNIDDEQDPSQISRLQLWILSKKARVLKMIEDLIKTHNEEIAAVSLAELITPSNSKEPSISNRLTEILNSMNSTTESSINDESELTTQMTISSILPIPNISESSLNLMVTTLASTQTETPNAIITTTQSSSDGNTLTTLSSSSLMDTFNIINRNAAMSTDEIIQNEETTTSSFLGTTTIDIFAEKQTTSNTNETPISNDIETTTIKENNGITTEILETNNDSTIRSTTFYNNDITTTTQKETTDSIISNTIPDTETTTEINISTETNSKSTTQVSLDSSSVLSKSENSLINFNLNNNQKNINTQPNIPKKDYVIFGILPNNTVVRKDPNDDALETLTEASPYIIYGVLPNNTVIRKFPNGTRVPRIMQKIDILPISPWSLRNPYSPIHNIPAIVRPQSNPIRESTNTVTFQDTSNNGTEIQLTTDTVNNLQVTISSSALNLKDSSSLGITSTINKPPAEKSTASHVLSLRTTTMLPSVNEILLNSISSAIKEDMVVSSMISSTHEPRILTLDIDPETKQIRTEKPADGNGNAVFRFIPIDEVTTSSRESNVQKITPTKLPTIAMTTSDIRTTTLSTVTEIDTQTSQIQPNNNEPTTTLKTISGISFDTNNEDVTVQFDSPTLINEVTTMSSNTVQSTTLETTQQTIASTTIEPVTTSPLPSTMSSVITTTTTSIPITMTTTPNTIPEITITTPTAATSTESISMNSPTTSEPVTVQTTNSPLITTTLSSSSTVNNPNMDEKDTELLQRILKSMERSPKKLGSFSNANLLSNMQQQDGAKLIQALLSGRDENTNNFKTSSDNTLPQTHSIEDDIRQFEEDTKLLKALLKATGRNPAELNLPNLDNIKALITPPVPITTPKLTTTTIPETTTTASTSTTTMKIIPTTSFSINDDIKKLQEDTKLLQALLQLTNNQNGGSLPVISGTTSNVRINGNTLTTSSDFKTTTPINARPVFLTERPVISTQVPEIVTVSTLQPQQPSTEEIRISTTFRLPIDERLTTTARSAQTTPTSSFTRRPSNPKFTITTEIPSTSTFSDEEDLLFLKNLKSVLGTKNDSEDPESALANRVIALAVERSLNEIQSGTDTQQKTSTTPRTTSTRATTTITNTPRTNLPSIEEDLKQFEQDSKLLQALLQATGQDPSKLNLPVLPDIKVSPNILPGVNEDLNILSNLLASPSPLNEPFDPLTQKPNAGSKVTIPSTVKTYGAKIAVKDDLKNEQDDAKLLQTLIQLQGAQETTTQKSKLAITGQSPDEALKKLIQQAQPTGMVSEATKSSISLSTEYGNTNDALLAALLKEQGFGPTTASSLDEQLRLAALLNQVVVTPKARRTTTTPPPPPPAPRRPILDGLAWLWQQWRDTAPSPDIPRPNRGPASSAKPSVQQSSATSSRVNWFGSGPFVGNANDRPTNRIPLDPPSAVSGAQAPGQGRLVSAAINVTRAFSQFLGAAIQGAAQTVQSVIRAGQRAATGGSG